MLEVFSSAPLRRADYSLGRLCFSSARVQKTFGAAKGDLVTRVFCPSVVAYFVSVPVFRAFAWEAKLGNSEG